MSLGPTYYRDQLARVNAAIEAVEAGAQTVEHQDKEVTYADIAALYRERRRLEPLAMQEAQKQSAGSASVVRFSTSKGV